MTWKHYLGITIVFLIILAGLASLQSAPGYMDAEYYFSMGLRIAAERSMSEPFIWNYLSGVETIPHPGFSYWMPLPAFLSALGIWISGLRTFTGARLVHILLASLVPALVMKVTWEETRNSSAGILAGLLALFPVFYNIFLGTTDSFAGVMLLGGLFFLLTKTGDKPGRFIFLGIIAGFMHLSRADGLIWVIVGLFFAVRAPEKRLPAILGVIGGYLVIMGPWYARNWIAIGRLMPSGLSGAFWFKEYDDLFIYSSTSLSYDSWISQGISAIFKTSLEAGLANLKTAVLVQGQIILAPFILIGAWKHRRTPGVQAIFLGWFCVFVIMSLIFPFAGMRGGYLHSSSAFQPLIWCFAASGFFVVIDWGVDVRNWSRSKAGKVFGSVLVSMVAVSAMFVFSSRVVGGDLKRPIWNDSYLAAQDIVVNLDGYGFNDELVMINNPPGFYAATGRSSVVIPSSGIDDVLQAGEEYGVRYLVLEMNHPRELNDLYQNPGLEYRLEYLGTHNDAIIFRFPE